MKRKSPGTIARRGNSYCVRFMQDGQRFTFSIKTDDRREAERFALAKFQALPKLAARRIAGIDDKMRLDGLLDAYSRQLLVNKCGGTARAYGDSLRPITDYFVRILKNPTVASVRAADVLLYLTWRRDNRRSGNHKSAGQSAPVSNRTLAKDRAVLHALFALACQMEWCDTNPVARTKAPKCDDRQPVMLTDDELDALLAECESATLTLFALVLADAGLRCESEALWLQWTDVRDGYVEIVSGRDGHRNKGGKSRRVPASARLAAALRDYAAEFRLGGGPWIFHRITTGERIKSLRRSFMAAAKRAKLPAGFHPHDLRHRCCTRLLESGANVADVMQFMGHADLATTQRYLHASGGHVERLRQMVG